MFVAIGYNKIHYLLIPCCFFNMFRLYEGFFWGEGHLGAFLALGATELQILPPLVNWVGKPDDSSV